MICPACKADQSAAARFCQACGAGLVAPQKPREGFGGAWWLILAAAGAVLVLSIAAGLGTTSTASTRPDTIDVSFSGAGFCAAEQIDAVHAYQALKSRDVAGFAGLSARGKVFTTEAGDRAVLVTKDSGLARLRMTSGFHIGERCWTMDGLVK